MDPLTSVALVGTARQKEPAGEAGGLVDGVLAALADVPMERRVLLAAGARATAAMAGARGLRSEEPPARAPDETRPVCSTKAARLVGDMLQGHHAELLQEALGLLARAGRRLPHALLPQAMRVRGDVLRAAMRPVLGERGVWLARMSDAWTWATAVPATASFEEVERGWSEGSPAVRRELLNRARAIDPARARALLEATWSTEKADERAALLAGLRTGISGDDEAFVEAQLRDRASGVRETAQGLLPHLPESAFVRRMTARADAILAFEAATLTANPPEKMDDAAERDGFTKPPKGVGARAFWMAHALAAVPVAHWTTRFAKTPDELVLAAEGTDWVSAMCEGWTRAALVSGEAAWLGALWDFFQRSDDKSVGDHVANSMSIAILQRMTPDDAATRVESLFDRASRTPLEAALQALPTPWRVSTGVRFLERLRRDLRAPEPATAMLSSLRAAALALPLPCLAGALEPFEVADSQASFSEHSLGEFVDVVRMRQDLVQEIVP